MMTLYHCVDARSFRPLWALEELERPYTLKILPFPPRVLAREYLQINPLGTVPAFCDGDTFMTESAAICEYLAARYGDNLLVQPDDALYGRYLNFLHFGEATLTFPQTLVLRYSKLELPQRRQPQVVEDYQRWFLARLKTISPLLASQAYLCGRFTVADISVGFALLLANELGLARHFTDPVRAYWERLQLRDGFRRAKQAQSKAAAEQGVSALVF
jgi:glutathione S-transferase